MTTRFTTLFLLAASSVAMAQAAVWQPDVTQQQTYTLHRASSADPTGANRGLSNGSLQELRRPSWMWVGRASSLTSGSRSTTGALSSEAHRPAHLLGWRRRRRDAKLPLEISSAWGWALIITGNLKMLSVGSIKAMNSYFPMPYRHHARITVTNEGKQPIGSLYYNVDYRTESHPLPEDTLYFHAQYRQAQPRPWLDQ